MCGIAGIFKFNGSVVSEVELHKMGASQKHRGPDSQDVWANERIGFAHQRLSIIDTSTSANQPFHSNNLRYTIVFNGEIYNYKELKTQLVTDGFTFRTSSDTEVLLNLFIKYGGDCLSMLNGMFAFAVWDNDKHELFVARDRFGVKPFYYQLNNEQFSFASEVKGIFAAGLAKEINSSAVSEWLMFRDCAGEETLYKHVKRLLPGHAMTISRDGNVTTNRWYNLGERIQKHHPIVNPVEWFTDTFHDSVKYRMVSDVPVGILLSGGLDSSSVTASVHKSGYEQISTFNIGFKNYIHDESVIARKFSESLNYPFHTINLEGKDLYQTLLNSIHHLDGPLVHMNDPQILAISSHAKSHVKVLLSGEGADEMLGGYVRYKTFKYLSYRKPLKLLLKSMPEKYKSGRLNKLERYLKLGGINQLIMSNASNYFESDFDKLGLKYLGITNNYRAVVLEEARNYFPNNPTKQLLYYDQHTYLQSLNDRNDRATMAASIECREPFQDYRLMEGAGYLSTDWLTKGKKGKFILKESMKNLLPDYITNFRKIGLSVPWIELINASKELSELWHAFINQPNLENELLDKIDFKKISTETLKGNTYYEPLMLQLFMFYLWKKTYLLQ